jgi:hypothetical protein
MAARRKRPSRADEKPPRSKATFDLPSELIAELRVASVMLPGEAVGANLSALAERLLRAGLEQLRAEYQGGKPFPTPSHAKAKRGRPAS